MSEPLDQERAMERRVHAALRSLEPVRAPRSLEARVLEAIEQRAAQPWWRTSFARWPRAARVGFVVASLMLVAGAMLLGHAPAAESLMTLPAHPLAAVPGASQAQALLASYLVLRAALEHAVPASWVYFALLASGTLYALLFGLGAAAYRALYLPAPSRT
ncbi:MAG TPA: hypothetical protein VKT22_12295 [Steroidobacteraceae bacterium]|nr:hypothetical protein [Steroidobacteraceae bacterium]